MENYVCEWCEMPVTEGQRTFTAFPHVHMGCQRVMHNKAGRVPSRFRCRDCQQWFPIADKYPRRPLCQPCFKVDNAAMRKRRTPEQKAHYKAYLSQWKVDNPNWKRDYDLRFNYGLTAEEFDTMAAAQDYKCAVCRNGVNGLLHVDHCHTTGKVRGLLCSPCNTSLGLLGEDPDRIRALAAYAERHDVGDAVSIALDHLAAPGKKPLRAATR